MVSSLPNPAASWSNKFICNSNSLHNLLKSKLGSKSIFLPKLHQDLCALDPPTTAISGQDKLQPRYTEYISHISKDARLHSGKNLKWKGFISKLCKAEKELCNWPQHLPLGDVFTVSYASMSTATFEQLWVVCNEARSGSGTQQDM